MRKRIRYETSCVPLAIAEHEIDELKMSARVIWEINVCALYDECRDMACHVRKLCAFCVVGYYSHADMASHVPTGSHWRSL